MSQSIKFENVTVTGFDYAFENQDWIYGFLISFKDEFFLDEKIVLKLSDAEHLIPFGFDDSEKDLSFKNKFVGQTISVKTKESKDFKGYFEFIEFIEIV